MYIYRKLMMTRSWLWNTLVLVVSQSHGNIKYKDMDSADILVWNVNWVRKQGIPNNGEKGIHFWKK